MATQSTGGGAGWLVVGILVAILFVLIAIAEFANAIVTLLSNAGLPPAIAGPVGSILFWGIILGIIFGILLVLFRAFSR